MRTARRTSFWLLLFMADILTNPKARRDYHILETFEAGIVLRGTEVKSLRAGKGQIRDAFARVDAVYHAALKASGAVPEESLRVANSADVTVSFDLSGPGVGTTNR